MPATRLELHGGEILLAVDKKNKQAIVLDLWVDYQYRERGLGTRLLGMAALWAVKQQIPWLVLDDARSKAAPNLYTRAGMTYVHLGCPAMIGSATLVADCCRQIEIQRR